MCCLELSNRVIKYLFVFHTSECIFTQSQGFDWHVEQQDMMFNQTPISFMALQNMDYSFIYSLSILDYS